ncbi:hypothetical protein Patl1_29783 [Pistacia atlantica]|uniref:Uncharacterized protein n=1 Tax=Pistacia atlantica TaxID=434234 RepID=A0ACC1A9W7_9ROSI|nr:hypothetical protein Patl1_29783 [Pistacia atlantica]
MVQDTGEYKSSQKFSQKFYKTSSSTTALFQSRFHLQNWLVRQKTDGIDAPGSWAWLSASSAACDNKL